MRTKWTGSSQEGGMKWKDRPAKGCGKQVQGRIQEVDVLIPCHSLSHPHRDLSLYRHSRYFTNLKVLPLFTADFKFSG